MSNLLSFPITASDGRLNPTMSAARFDLKFWDADTGTWRQKQSPSWDGGWRWMHSDYADVLVVYNTADPTCSYELTHLYLLNSYLEPELIFEIAKVSLTIDINCRAISEWNRRQFRYAANRLWQELFPDVDRVTIGKNRYLKEHR